MVVVYFVDGDETFPMFHPAGAIKIKASQFVPDKLVKNREFLLSLQGCIHGVSRKFTGTIKTGQCSSSVKETLISCITKR